MRITTIEVQEKCFIVKAVKAEKAQKNNDVNGSDTTPITKRIPFEEATMENLNILYNCLMMNVDSGIRGDDSGPDPLSTCLQLCVIEILKNPHSLEKYELARSTKKITKLEKEKNEISEELKNKETKERDSIYKMFHANFPEEKNPSRFVANLRNATKESATP